MDHIRASRVVRTYAGFSEGWELSVYGLRLPFGG